MITSKGRPPKPLPKTLNRVTGKYSSQAIGFNDTAWGPQTRSYVKMIHTQLRNSSYDKIVAAAKPLVKVVRRRVPIEEVIDLTGEDEDECAMLIDLPSDEDNSEDNSEDSSDTDSDTDSEDDSEEEGSAPHALLAKDELPWATNHSHEMGSVVDLSVGSEWGEWSAF